MKKIHENSRKSYGTRRIRPELVEEGELISHRRVACLMKQQGLKSKSQRPFKVTTNSNHGCPVAPNRLGQAFRVDHVKAGSTLPSSLISTPGRWCLVPSDQGSQYASDRYQKTLQDHGFICSMSRQGCCSDNAPAESFFHTLKTELTHHRHYQTREKAQQEIFESIKLFYNRQRHHSTLGYQTPLGYEKDNRK